MLSVSFYLLTPTAKSQSQVYVSISDKTNRLRFATGKSFVTSYCNIRTKKGTKDLVKKGCPFYFDYNSSLNKIRDSLIRLEMEFSNRGESVSLEKIRDLYYKQIGKLKAEPALTFELVYRKFVAATESQWSEGTRKHFTTLQNHLTEYEKTNGEIVLEKLNEEFWNELRDEYFVKKKKFGNASTNANLKKFKQFLKYAKKKEFINTKINFEDLKYLDEVEPFKIALKDYEVESLFELNLSNTPRLEKVRDLFTLEILTGQRFSDISKVLDQKHILDSTIEIYQQKTGEKVTIPLHPKLREHLKKIFEKYPNGFPAITNQKFNLYIKEVCVLAKINKEHSWITQTGKKKIHHSDFRYNLVGSHTGRRTFCTLALKNKINSELIMKVTGHKNYNQFRQYIKVDDDDLGSAFESMFN